MAKNVKDLLNEENLDQQLNEILESLNQDVQNPDPEMKPEVTNIDALQGHENMVDLKTPEGETGGNDVSAVTSDDVVDTNPPEEVEAPDKALIESGEEIPGPEANVVKDAQEETPAVDPKEVSPQAAQSEDVKGIVVEETEEKKDDDDKSDESKEDDKKDSDDKDDDKKDEDEKSDDKKEDAKEDDKKSVNEDVDSDIADAVADVAQAVEASDSEVDTASAAIEAEAEAALAQAEQDNIDAIEKAADEAIPPIVDEANLEPDTIPPVDPDGTPADDVVRTEITPEVEHIPDSSFEESMANIFKILKETSEDLPPETGNPIEVRNAKEEAPEVKEDEVAPTAAQSEDVKPVVVEEIQDNEGTEPVPDAPESTVEKEPEVNVEEPLDNKDMVSTPEADLSTPDSNEDQTGTAVTPETPVNDSAADTDTPVVAADKEAEAIAAIPEETADKSEDVEAPESNEGTDPVIPQPETNVVSEEENPNVPESDKPTEIKEPVAETPEVTNDDVYCDCKSDGASDLETPAPVDAIVEESFVPYNSIREAFMLQENYFECESRVKVSPDQKAKRLTEQVALVIAKESKDPLYEELVRAAANAKSLQKRLVESYSQIAADRALKIIKKKKCK